MIILDGISKKITKYRAIKKLQYYLNYKSDEKIIYLLSPEHGNLGDQAIAIAISKFLHDKYTDKLIVEFSFHEYLYVKDNLHEIINAKDIIFLHGGGNLGNLYINEEILRRDVIGKFMNNKIVIMPQSISFTTDSAGVKELETTKKIYNNHINLNIVCRENKSLETAKSIFPSNNLFLSPDSVMYLENEYLEEEFKREGVLFAFRSDKEKVVNEDIIKGLEDKFFRKGENIKYKDTIIRKKLNEKTREKELLKILRAFGNSKLVITDRFHGVIFSVITRTPCIVFKSLDHKISEGIRWFENKDYIYYVESESEDLQAKIDEYLNIKIHDKETKLKSEFSKAFHKILGN